MRRLLTWRSRHHLFTLGGYYRIISAHVMAFTLTVSSLFLVSISRSLQNVEKNIALIIPLGIWQSKLVRGKQPVCLTQARYKTWKNNAAALRGLCLKTTKKSECSRDLTISYQRALRPVKIILPKSWIDNSSRVHCFLIFAYYSSRLVAKYTQFRFQ